MAPNLKMALTNVPVLTRTLLSSLVLVTGLATIYIRQQALTAPHCPVLGLVPGLIMHAPWTIVTSIFFENTLWTFTSSLIILLLCGKYLERAWGSRELLIYILVTGIGANTVTWFGLVLTFYLTGDDQYLYETQINGFAGIFAAFLVAFKSLIPEHRVEIFGGLIAIRVKNILGLVTLFSILGLLLFRALVFYNLVNIGWVVGWIFLRFFKVQEGGVRGDRSEAFALVTFFPEFLSPVIGGLSTIVYNVLVSCHLCPPMRPVTMYDMENPASSHSLAPLPGSARAEAERRRALALKALDMRLSTKPASTSVPDPNTAINADALMEQQQQQQQPAIKNDVLFDASSEISKEG